jgi:putative transposase
VAEALLKFFEKQGITPSRITPGKPWQNGSNESFNGTFRHECLDAERFHSVTEARLVIEDWRQQYNHERPHSALGYQTPARIYGEEASRQITEVDTASSVGENLSNTLGRQATIVRQHNGEIGEQSGPVATTEAISTQKT